ncbi:MAG: sigma-70 family RNA polymerase sigma factor [Isosphaerales bacterium]
MPANPGTTNPILLLRLADWRDHPAWGEFVARYAPLVRSRCRRFHLDDDATDEVCQRIWIGLSQRLLTFRYDPTGSFRSWLRRYCDSRLIDRLRERGSVGDVSLDQAFGPDGPPAKGGGARAEDDEPRETEHPRLLTLAAEIHEHVRVQVNPETWRAFWLVAVEDCSVREAADNLGKSYAATFAAQKRVRRMLREEGRKVLEESGEAGSAPRMGSAFRAPI